MNKDHEIESMWVFPKQWTIPTIRIHIRMPACDIDRISLQPACRAGVILTGADMI
ncbi:hypothetical protein GXSOP10_13125 [Armatimonadetes bacterium GXS]|jgi:hypothetical protein|nr:hypothetical protein GXSOP10_13125 [Armatimonadetes bacterium GXS]